jgi:hypothetical protein
MGRSLSFVTDIEQNFLTRRFMAEYDREDGRALGIRLM